MDVSLVERMPKAGKRTMGIKETTARGSPSFVHKTTKKAISASKELCVELKKVKERKQIKKAINSAISIFFVCTSCSFTIKDLYVLNYFKY